MVMLHCLTINHVTVSVAGVMMVLHCKTYFIFCYSFSSLGDGGVPLQDLFHVLVTVSVAGVMVVLHCKTCFMFCYIFSSRGEGGFTLQNLFHDFVTVTLQDNMSCFLHSFSSWGDAGVTLQDLFHVFFTVSAAGVMVVLHCKTIICV